MQVDAPTEDNDNAEEEPYIVENPTLVRIEKIGLKIILHLLNIEIKSYSAITILFPVLSGLGSVC